MQATSIMEPTLLGRPHFLDRPHRTAGAFRGLLTGLLFTAIGGLTATPSARADAGLDRAYLKELAFLKAEKDTLTRRLRENEQSSATRITEAKASIDRLEGQLLLLKERGRQIDEALRSGEMNEDAKNRPEDLASIVNQGASALGQAGLDVERLSEERAPSAAEAAAALSGLFSKATHLVAQNGARRVEKGSYFLPDGSLVDGKILWLGAVAALGLSDRGSGALAPAGENKLRLWPEEAKETAAAMVKGGEPMSMRLFLFENTDHAIEPKKEKTFSQEATLGGVIAWVIVALGAVAIVMILIRFYTLTSLATRGRTVTRAVVAAVSARRFAEAKSFLSKEGGAAARVLSAAVNNLHAERTHLEDLLQEAILNETPAIERFGSAITVFAAVAPLLGLLGTVTGMIATFDVITEFGTGDPRMLSGGISEALITTKFGLIVAIPCLLIGNVLSGWAESAISDIEHAALRVVNAAHGLDLEDLSREDREAEPSRAQPEPA